MQYKETGDYFFLLAKIEMEPLSNASEWYYIIFNCLLLKLLQLFLFFVRFFFVRFFFDLAFL